MIVPETVLSSVDFPAPFEPMTVTKSPSFTVRLTPFRATRSLTVPAKNVLRTSSTVSMRSRSLSG